jgi:hypothetical protein
MLKKIHHHLHRHYHARYHGKYTHAKQLFIFDIFLLILAVVILISGVVFLLKKPVVKDDVEMIVTTNIPTLKSGTPMKLTIEFTNTSKTTLYPSTLAIRLPHGFIVDRNQTPESILNKENTISITAPLAPGAKGHVDIAGQWWVDQSQPEILFATLSYYTDKHTELNQKIISFTPAIPSSILETHLDIATSSFPNQSIPFTYSLTNTSDKPTTHITLLPNWQGTITITSTILEDFTIAPHETKTISGTVTAPKSADIYNFGIRSQVTVQDYTFKQTTNQEPVQVVYPTIVSEARLSKTTPYIEPGQEIPINIHWRNDSTFTLTNQRLHIRLSPKGVIDMTKTALTNGITIEGDDLIITSAQKTALANGAPGAEDTFDLKLETLPTFKITGEKVNLDIIPRIEAQALSIKEQQFTREGNKISIPIASEVALTRNEVRYYTPEGDQIGRGTLPPQVGKTTKYWILLQIANTTNELKDATLKIHLAPGVTFSTSNQSVTLGPQVQFNKDTNTVEWNYSNVPANSRTGWNFMVEVTPTVDQIGKTLSLITSGTFTATDGIVKKEFEIKFAEMNNVLPGNDKGSRMGAKVKK